MREPTPEEVLKYATTEGHPLRWQARCALLIDENDDLGGLLTAIAFDHKRSLFLPAVEGGVDSDFIEESYMDCPFEMHFGTCVFCDAEREHEVRR